MHDKKANISEQYNALRKGSTHSHTIVGKQLLQYRLGFRIVTLLHERRQARHRGKTRKYCTNIKLFFCSNTRVYQQMSNAFPVQLRWFKYGASVKYYLLQTIFFALHLSTHPCLHAKTRFFKKCQVLVNVIPDVTPGMLA